MEEMMSFTPFEDIYKSFLSKITDDMYMELDENQTNAMLLELLENAINLAKEHPEDVALLIRTWLMEE